MIIPDRFNIADAICKRHADAITRIAVLEAKPAGFNTYTYGGLSFISDKFAIVLTQFGIEEGDAVAIILPQSAAFIASVLGAMKAGAVAVQLPPSLQKEDIEHALRESKAKAVVASSSIRAEVAELTAKIENNGCLFIAGDSREANAPGGDAKSFWHEVYEASSDFAPVDTESSSPALISYAKGSDGNLRRAVRSHASLTSQLARFEMLNVSENNEDSASLSATDWSPVDVLPGFILPALWYGCAVSIESRDGHSYLSATIGSTRVALRAGI